MRRPRLVSTSAAACCARHARAKRAPRKQLSLPLSLFAIPFAAQAKSCTNLRRSTRRATAPAVASCTSLRASSYSSICARSTTSGASRAVVGSQSKLANRAGLHCMPSQAPRSREVALCLPSWTRQLSSLSKVMPFDGLSSREAYEAALAEDAHEFSSCAAYEAALAASAHSRESASQADASGQSPATGASSPERAPDRLQRRQFACKGVSSSPATGVSSPAKASPALAKASASANALPPKSCLGPPATGVTSPAAASSSLARAPSSPATAALADGDLPGGLCFLSQEPFPAARASMRLLSGRPPP